MTVAREVRDRLATLAAAAPANELAEMRLRGPNVLTWHEYYAAVRPPVVSDLLADLEAAEQRAETLAAALAEVVRVNRAQYGHVEYDAAPGNCRGCGYVWPCPTEVGRVVLLADRERTP